MQKFKNKYQIKSSRLQNYDYSQNGMYFITICTKDKEEFFGEIKNGKIKLNEIGKITDRCWQEIPKHFPFVKLDIHQIMPNHIHGIIEICYDINDNSDDIADTHCNTETQNQIVETQNFASLHFTSLLFDTAPGFK